jgi:hypothetical protein
LPLAAGEDGELFADGFSALREADVICMAARIAKMRNS